MSPTFPNNPPADPNLRIRNAHMLELAELAQEANPLVLTWALLGATFPGESIPVDVVDR